MKKLIISSAIIFAAAFVFNSCTMEKRHYRNGYHVEWNSNKETVDVKKENGKSISTAETVAMQETTASEVNVADENLNQAITSVVSFAKPVTNQIESNSVVSTNKTSNAIQEKKILKKTSAFVTSHPVSSGGDDNKVLLIVLCFFIPPLAVYLYEGSWTHRCTVNLILTLLCGLPGMIHALIIIIGDK
ncbi:hypothetical protein BH09BAC5_BH09BAC5_04130 [soil metagenome]